MVDWLVGFEDLTDIAQELICSIAESVATSLPMAGILPARVEHQAVASHWG